jgi:hypothetical protein
MISINVIDNKISGSYGDKTFSIDFDKELYDKMQTLAESANNADTIAIYHTALKAFEPLTIQDYTKTVQDKCEFIHVNKSTGEFFLQHNGVVSSIPMPEALVERIYESMDKGLDFMPLVKMWTRWLRNPVLRTKMKKGWGREFCERFFNYINLKYVHPKLKEELMEEHGLSEEVAERRATMYQMKITKEGLLNGYKVSEEVFTKFEEGENGEVNEVPRYKRTFNVDTGEIESEGLPEHVEDRLFIPAVMGKGGDAFFCEGTNGYPNPCHFIKVGCTHRLPDWSYVNTNDRRSCVKGLHFGGLEYINCISGEIHNIFVDPMHIGAVPDDETGAARCLQYFVHSSLVGVNGSIYHSSTYAAKTDEEWAEMRSKAVQAKSECKIECDKEVAELTQL